MIDRAELPVQRKRTVPEFPTVLSFGSLGVGSGNYVH